MLLIHTCAKAHCRERLGRRAVVPENWSIKPGTWAYEMLLEIAESSRTVPIQRSIVSALEIAFSVIASTREWINLGQTPIEKLDMTKVLEVFRIFEARIAEGCLSKRSQAGAARQFRELVRTYLSSQKRCPQAIDLLHPFRSKITYRRVPRMLISDMVANNMDGASAAPIGALRHQTVAQLKETTKTRLESDLRMIEDACEKEFRDYDRQCAWLGEISDRHPEMKGAHDMLWQRGGKSENGLRGLFSSMDADQLLAFYLAHANSTRQDRNTPPFGIRDRPGGYRVLEYARTFGHDSRVSKLRQLLLLPQLGTGTMMLSCLLVLQIHTGWNSSSVLSLRRRDVQDINGIFQLQGFKSKSDDHTPISFVTPRDRAAHYALTFLLRRLNELQIRNFVSTEQDSMFMGTIGYYDTLRIFAHQRALSSFQKRHALPKFSLEQIRVQVLAIASLGAGGIESARRIAGHKNISTTSGYLIEQVLLTRLNSSINLEFQERLEASVIYASSLKAGAARDIKFEKEFFLLYPVGDGSLCRHPQKPPTPEWLVGEVCSAENCHTAAGCGNNVLFIDEKRIEEVAATSLFYESSWQRLQEGSRFKFLEVHSRAMLFNLALAGFIERGPYRHLLKQAYRRLGSTSPRGDAIYAPKSR